MREEHVLRVFVSRVLKQVFRRKRDEVTGESRKVHSAHKMLFGS